MKTVDIIERIEGEAKLTCLWKNNKISDAHIDFLNFRGFEYILKEKTPLDTLIYTPRICGICGQAHLKATVTALENIYENIGEAIQISQKARYLRQIGLNIEIIDSHIKWFYMYILPDIILLDRKDLGIYEPLKGKRWKEALGVASETIKALAIIAGQWPHSSYMLPGGVVSDPTLMDLLMMQNYLNEAIKFFQTHICALDFEEYLSLSGVKDLDKIKGDLAYFRDLAFKYSLEESGKAYNNFISLGESFLFKSGKKKQRLAQKIDFTKIRENEEYTFSLNSKDKKKRTWSKAVTYDGNFYETGPLSRAIISNRTFIKEIHKTYEDSVFTRVFARVDEIAHLLNMTKELISKIKINEDSYIKPKINLHDIKQASGISVVEATRGSLYHKINIENGKVKSYDIITPTVWNLGPENEQQKGIAQKAIINSTSLDIAKIILRSFDVCSVCTTH